LITNIPKRSLIVCFTWGIAMLRVFTLMLLVLMGCSSDLPDPALRGAQATSADSAKTSLTRDKKQEIERYIKLKEVNSALCLRYQKQILECPLSSPLRADDSSKVLGCVSGVDPNATVGADFKISVQPPPGTKIYLSTKGGMWRTNEVGAGTAQKLTWGPMKGDICRSNLRAVPAQAQLRSPKMLEVEDLEVVVVPEDKKDCGNGSNRISQFGAFELSLNGNPLFSKSDLTYRGGAHFLKLDAIDGYIYNEEKRSKCIVSSKEVEEITREAEKNAPLNVTLSKEQAASMADDYNRETSRNNSLQQALSGQEKLGCWAFAKVDKLEVKIEGRALPRQSWGTGEEAKGSGNGRAFSFSFGRGIAHSISEENGLFRPGGGFVTNAFSGRYLQELQFIRIEKQGTTFENEQFSTTFKCGFLNLRRCTKREFRRFETDRRNLSSIKILVNDQLIYERNLNHDFQTGSLQWLDKDLQSNQKYRDLMRNTSCPAI
jgi:hypothetical protein